ncbi:MAG: hypothetical protein NT093_02595, partial [Candidatus Moranbacteria bacterium]|nr:hypothetical protein [Candidatus Moranbacteria bacterium]
SFILVHPDCASNDRLVRLSGGSADEADFLNLILIATCSEFNYNRLKNRVKGVRKKKWPLAEPS